MPAGRLEHKKIAVGYGLLVRNRRIAEAIATLGTRHAYEGRMLLRSMLEIQINYWWLRRGRTDSRARRFLRFDPLERLQITTDIQSAVSSTRLANAQARLVSSQAATRHLFRKADSKGKLKWDKHWASVSSLRDRFIEVSKAEGQSPNETFTYGLYRWASSAVHGGPFSLMEVLEATPLGARAKAQPESDSHAQLHAAAGTLATTVTLLAKDARMVRSLQPALGQLLRDIKARHR